MDPRRKMEFSSRLQLTKKMMAGIRQAPPPPPGFNPMRASDSELIQYGFPPRPDKDTHPRGSTLWAKMMSRPLNYSPLKFSINTDQIREPQDAASNVPPASSSNWSGAVLTSPPPGTTFYAVSASWVVPDAYPPPSAKSGTTFTDGTYQCSVWVGIDGWIGPENTELIQMGTSSRAIVTGGQVTQSAYAWFEWFPAFEVPINFSVKPGDLIHVLVCAGISANNQATVYITNEGADISASFSVTAPTGSTLKGLSAEWIVEDPSGPNGQFPFPDYGAVFFYDTMAWVKDAKSTSTEENLTNSTLVDMTNGRSTAVEETPEVLMVYAYDNGP